MTRSCRPSRFVPTAAMRPSRMETSPSTTSNRSFIVTTMPPRMRSDINVRKSYFRLLLRELRRRPAQRSRVFLAVLHGDQLGEDADGDLLRRHGADVEADWRVHALEQGGRRLVLGERAVDARDLGAAADQSEIAQVARRERAQRLEVVGMAAGDDHHVRMRGDIRARDPGRDVIDDDLRGGRKTLGVGELLAIVHDMHAEADLFRDPREMETDVTGADDVELGRGLDGLDVDVHLAAADQPRLLGEVVVKLVMHQLRLARADRLACFAEGVVFVAPAADRADQAPIAEDEHLRADALWRRSGGRNDRHQCRRLAALERIGHGGKHFTVHLWQLYGANRQAAQGRWYELAYRCRSQTS